MTVGLIVVAAGTSNRMSGVDKVWADIGGRPAVWHALRRFTPMADRTALVVHPACLHRTTGLCSEFPHLRIVAGGAERHISVRNGLEALGDADVIAVHDAARPFAPGHLLHAGIQRLSEGAGAVPALPLVDAVKQVNMDGWVQGTLERSLLRAVQTPQVFRSGTLRDAHDHWDSTTPAFDDATMLERLGFRVCVFPGDQAALKITSRWDLQVVRLLYAQGAFQ